MQGQYGIGEYRTSETGFTFTSRAVKASGTQRAVIICHGGGGSPTLFWNNFAPLLLPLGEAGYVVHVGAYGSSTYTDGGGGVWTWGNSDSVTAVDAAITWLGTQGARVDKVCLYGTSMGACTALNYYKANPSKVQAIALTIPLLDLNDITSNDKGVVAGAYTNSYVDASMYGLSLPQATIALSETVAASGLQSTLGWPPGASGTANVLTSDGWQKVSFTGLSGSSMTGCTGGTGTMSSSSLVSQGAGFAVTYAYGISWPTQFTAPQLAANSPIVWSETTGAMTAPIKVWSADNDPVAATTAVCQAWAAAVPAVGGGNVTPTVVSLGNVGHDASVVPPNDVCAFFDANGGR